MAIKEYLIPHTIFFDQTIEVTDEILAQFIKEICAVPTDFQIKGSCSLPFQKRSFQGSTGIRCFHSLPKLTQISVVK